MPLIKLPGLIDPHVHLRDPGQTGKEDFFTGTSAALAGGFTTVIDMPNNKIPITTLRLLKEKQKIAREKIVCDIGFYFGSLGDNLEEFPKVQNLAKGLKLYLNETTGNFIIEKGRVEKIFRAWGSKPILLHAEGDAVEFIINLVKKTGKTVHFCHIAAQKDLELIIKSKEENLPITCGVTPHHLFLNETNIKKLGPFGKMKPYLKSKKDVGFLWKNLQYIDVIESDHAPHTFEEKRGENPPFGVPGLETTLPLLLTAVFEHRLVIDEIIRLCYTNPAKIFNIRTYPQTYIEIDQNTKYEIRNTNLLSKSGWSPFHSYKVTGRIERVFLRGKKVFEDGEILAHPGSGKILT